MLYKIRHPCTGISLWAKKWPSYAKKTEKFNFRLFFPYSLYIIPSGPPGHTFPKEFFEDISQSDFWHPWDALNGLRELIWKLSQKMLHPSAHLGCPEFFNVVAGHRFPIPRSHKWCENKNCEVWRLCDVILTPRWALKVVTYIYIQIIRLKWLKTAIFSYFGITRLFFGPQWASNAVLSIFLYYSCFHHQLACSWTLKGSLRMPKTAFLEILVRFCRFGPPEKPP